MVLTTAETVVTVDCKVVTTGGDNIAPQKIESLFATLETTAQELIFGDN